VPGRPAGHDFGDGAGHDVDHGCHGFLQRRDLRRKPAAVFTFMYRPVFNGTVALQQGDLQGARSYMERALAVREAQLGADHPTTANSLNNLAAVHRALGDLDGARALYQRALAILEARQGPDHPGTARSLNNLASVLADQGDLETARTLLERALTIRETRLGADHPDTVRSRQDLAAVVGAQENRK